MTSDQVELLTGDQRTELASLVGEPQPASAALTYRWILENSDLGMARAHICDRLLALDAEVARLRAEVEQDEHGLGEQIRSNTKMEARAQVAEAEVEALRKHLAEVRGALEKYPDPRLAQALLDKQGEINELRDAITGYEAYRQLHIQASTAAHDHFLTLTRERDELRAHILDIDAHATPYGDIPDEPGWAGTYLLTAGALHRALGKIGHTAPKCQAEAEVAELRQETDRLHAELTGWDTEMGEIRAERDALRARRTVAGWCPMGCGNTLALDPCGSITCTNPGCPRPDAAADILGDGETEHVVQLDPHEFTVRHPLRERLDDALMTCTLHGHVKSMARPPHPPGRYRVYRARADSDDGWTWEPANDGGGRG